MKTIDLSKYGINGVKEIVHNPSYEELFIAETDPSLEGYEKGVVTELGAVNVMTGVYTATQFVILAHFTNLVKNFCEIYFLFSRHKKQQGSSSSLLFSSYYL